MIEATPANRKKINLALQGGGAHGAFTWGVLDRLLEDARLDIEGVSGTSAGAMNAVVLAQGLMQGGPEEARRALTRFWSEVSRQAVFSPIQRSPVDLMHGGWSLDWSPGLIAFDLMTRLVSPYQFNPLNINPLRDFVTREIDFTAVQACDCLKLYISATNVLTGGVRVFTGPEVTADAVMASACLPQLFQAVEIDGVPYWDGGFMGNPVLYPFFDCCSSPDVVIVQINPLRRKERPTSAREIQDRVNEISFNASLLRELKQVDFVNRCLRQGQLVGLGYREVHLHVVAGGDIFDDLGASTKLNAEWGFLNHLFAIGRAAAESFLAQHFEALGQRSTMNPANILEEVGFTHPAG